MTCTANSTAQYIRYGHTPSYFGTLAYRRTSYILEMLCTTVVLMTKGDSKYESYFK